MKFKLLVCGLIFGVANANAQIRLPQQPRIEYATITSVNQITESVKVGTSCPLSKQPCTDTFKNITKGYTYVANYNGSQVSGFTKRYIFVGGTVRVNVVMSVVPAEN